VAGDDGRSWMLRWFSWPAQYTKNAGTCPLPPCKRFLSKPEHPIRARATVGFVLPYFLCFRFSQHRFPSSSHVPIETTKQGKADSMPPPPNPSESDLNMHARWQPAEAFLPTASAWLMPHKACPSPVLSQTAQSERNLSRLSSKPTTHPAAELPPNSV